MFEQLYPARNWLGECPTWDPDRQKLWWIDWVDAKERQASVHSIDPLTGLTEAFPAREHAGSIGLCDDGRVLIARSKDIAVLTPETGEVTKVMDIPVSQSEDRMNDGKVDPFGRFWFGSISSSREGKLYCLEPGFSELRVVLEGIEVSNGLGWSPDNSTFYHTDSGRHQVNAYDYDLGKGEITNRRTILDLAPTSKASLDGLAVDENGHLWIALWDGSGVLHLDTTGQTIEQINVPMIRPTSLAFGGKDYDHLFLTSAGAGLKEDTVVAGISNGDLLQASMTLKGVPQQTYQT